MVTINRSTMDFDICIIFTPGAFFDGSETIGTILSKNFHIVSKTSKFIRIFTIVDGKYWYLLLLLFSRSGLSGLSLLGELLGELLLGELQLGELLLHLVDSRILFLLSGRLSGLLNEAK